jgi:hypothetical protein
MTNLVRYITTKNAGLGLVFYAVASYALATFGLLKDLNPNWQFQLLAIGGVGGLFLYWVKHPEKAMFKFPGDNLPPPVAPVKPVKSNYTVGISEEEFKDFAAVDHLTDRFISVNDTEAITLCKSIQVKLFDIHHRVEAKTVISGDVSAEKVG